MTSPPSQRLRVATYNIRKAIGNDRRRDPERIVRVLAELNADIVALQEADRRLGERPSALPRAMLAEQTDYTVADLARTPVSLGWHGNAILVRRGITIRAAGHIELPGLEPRGAVRVALGTELGPLTVIGTHLGLLRPWRLQQLARIRAALEPEDITRTVVLADFNEWSRVRGVEILEAALDVVSPGPSFPAWRPLATLDRVGVGQDLACVSSGVLDTPLAGSASDHLPVWADITRRQSSKN